MLKQILVASSVVLMAFAGQAALAGPVLDIDPDLMGIPRGGIVVDHQPHPTGGPGSDTNFVEVSSPLTWQLSADDFTLTSPATIRHITWWGFYGSTFGSSAEQPPATQTMRLRFYDARIQDGLPGTVLFEETFLDPFYAWTGRRVLTGPAPDEYKFEIDLSSPMQLVELTTYWIEIIQIGDPSSLYRWESSRSSEINGFAFQNAATNDWIHTQNTTSDLAFQLSTIPEPSSAALMLLPCFYFSCRGGRKEAQRWVGNLSIQWSTRRNVS